jgi:hypothetical protein
MKLDKITEQEILDLLEKTEQEQINLFASRHILIKRTNCVSPCGLIYESLADLAERLWEKARDRSELDQVMAQISRNCGQRAWVDFFAYKAKPIHRIVAAIIALKRAGIKL